MGLNLRGELEIPDDFLEDFICAFSCDRSFFKLTDDILFRSSSTWELRKQELEVVHKHIPILVILQAKPLHHYSLDILIGNCLQLRSFWCSYKRSSNFVKWHVELCTVNEQPVTDKVKVVLKSIDVCKRCFDAQKLSLKLLRLLFKHLKERLIPRHSLNLSFCWQLEDRFGLYFAIKGNNFFQLLFLGLRACVDDFLFYYFFRLIVWF